MPSATRLATLVLGLLALPACDRLELSDEGQYWLNSSLVIRTSEGGGKVLVGSEFTLSIDSLAIDGEVDEDQGGLECASQSAGPNVEEFDSDRFRVTGEGPGAVLLAPPIESCPVNTDILITLGPDSWSFVGVSDEGVEARWLPLYDSYLRLSDISPGGRGVFPDAFGRPLDELRVVAEAPFRGVPMLIDATQDEVRYDESQSLLDAPAHFADLLSDENEPQELSGTLRAGDSFTPSFTVLDRPYALGEVVAVPRESIASLEVFPLYEPDDGPEREWGYPIGALAIARDHEGRRVAGPPVEWTITQGRLASTSAPGDFFILDSLCREVDAPEYRSATVEARLGELVEIVTFEWTALPGDAADGNLDNCPHDCSCSSAGEPSDAAPFGVGLLVLMILRRRQADSRTRGC